MFKLHVKLKRAMDCILTTEYDARNMVTKCIYVNGF